MRRIWLYELAAILAFAACGSPSSETPQSLIDAASAAAQQGSARTSFEGTMELPEEAGGGDLTMTGEGEISFDPLRTHIVMKMSGEGAAELALGGGEMEVVAEGLVMYMKFPQLSSMIPGAKEWIRIDLQEAVEELGIDMSQLTQLGGGDPSQQLAYLQGMTDVEDLGQEEIRGVTTTHYTGTVDFDILEDEAPQEAIESIQNLRELSGIDEIPMEVWLDRDGLPRRLHMELEYDPPDDAPAGTPSGTQTMTIEYFDFGVDVEVELPPDSEVTDLEDLM